MRVAATRGLQEVSLRHVAAEAGVSAGMVQHYFRTKDEMMTFALGVISERVETRLACSAADHPAPTTPAALVRTLLIEMLPLDQARQLEGHVGLAFHAYVAVKPELAEKLREDTDRMQGFLADQIRAAQDAGHAAGRLDPDHEARTLLALVEGLSLLVLAERCDPGTARATFERHLTEIFGPADACDAPGQA